MARLPPASSGLAMSHGSTFYRASRLPWAKLISSASGRRTSYRPQPWHLSSRSAPRLPPRDESSLEGSFRRGRTLRSGPACTSRRAPRTDPMAASRVGSCGQPASAPADSRFVRGGPEVGRVATTDAGARRPRARRPSITSATNRRLSIGPECRAAVAAPTMPLYPSSGSMLLPLADRLYRVVYGGLLSRLPEATAVRLGQTLFRALPVAPLRALAVDDPRLAVELAGVRLPGPLILSSMYYDVRILRRAMALGFGAVTAKSITVGPRPGHPEPNLVRVTTPAGPGLVNCNGFQNPGLEAFRAALPRLRHDRPRHRERGRRVPGGVPAARRRPSSRTPTSSRSTSPRRTRGSSTSCPARRPGSARSSAWSARPRGSRSS